MANSAVLVGLPGSGKTTVGRQLAKRLGVVFVDTDQLIEQRVGTNIPNFFELHGEDAFRRVEQIVIGELPSIGEPAVVSTGGGAILRLVNRLNLRKVGLVIYLKSSPEDLYRRLKHDTSRPLLRVGDPMAKLRELFEVRDPLYRDTAHFTVETGRPSVATLVNMIAMQLELSGDGALNKSEKA